jgi:hypothetical protein
MGLRGPWEQGDNEPMHEVGQDQMEVEDGVVVGDRAEFTCWEWK